MNQNATLPSERDRHLAGAKAAVARQRALQAAIDAKDRKAAQQAKAADEDDDKGKHKAPVQAGERDQPENPLPAQHLRKPGRESDLKLEPRWRAPGYVGSGKLQDRVAIVTGGDSGIGRAVAVLFAREGADVAILHLDEQDDADTTAEAVRAEGRRAITIAGDVGDSAFCEYAVAEVVAEFGRLDVLVNNAGFQLHANALEDLADAHLQETLNTNVAGYVYMARACVPHLGEGGCIINNGSQTGLLGSATLLDYSASKGAIHAFTMALASHLLPRGIRVNAVAPGPVWTPFNPADRPADEVATFGQDSAMGRPAQPEEIAPAFVFLASPVMSSYVNGIVLPVMGGPQG